MKPDDLKHILGDWPGASVDVEIVIRDLDAEALAAGREALALEQQPIRQVELDATFFLLPGPHRASVRLAYRVAR